MTESDWFSTDSPNALFRHVRTRLSARKLQLIACGCCRLYDDAMSAHQREHLSAVERHADGLADRDEYQSAVEEFGRNTLEQFLITPAGVVTPPGVSPDAALAQALMAVVSPPADFGLDRVISWLPSVSSRLAGPGEKLRATQKSRLAICGVFREVVGNPFVERVSASPEWTAAGGKAASWMLKVGETARNIALGVQAEQAFDRLPILADALEDDGCADADLLAHLRHQSHHLRGCWAVDLVLGKS